MMREEGSRSLTMVSLGHTRSASRRDHLLQTPDTFVRIPLPCLKGGLAIVHTGSAARAAFTEYTVELEPEGVLSGVALDRFLYVLEGESTLEASSRQHRLRRGSYAYVPASVTHSVIAQTSLRAVVIEQQPAPTAHQAPPLALVVGHEDDHPAAPLLGDPDLQVRSLLPEDPGFRFAVNTMTYQPGAALAQVEVHIMEHGLLMLEGGGIYRLGEHWYPVHAGDFIWMGPFCPQWFGAIGKTPAKYLIYKDWNQHPMR